MNTTVKAAIAAMSLLTFPVSASEMSPIFSSGSWTVQAGKSDLGTPMCEMQEVGKTDMIAIKWFQGADHLTIHMVDPSWQISGGNEVPVQLQMDKHSPWHVTATAYDTRVGIILEFFIKGELTTPLFIHQMQDSRILQVSFPGSSARDLTFAMSGSRDSLAAFGRCVGAVAKMPVPTPDHQVTAPDHDPGRSIQASPTGRTQRGDIIL